MDDTTPILPLPEADALTVFNVIRQLEPVHGNTLVARLHLPVNVIKASLRQLLERGWVVTDKERRYIQPATLERDKAREGEAFCALYGAEWQERAERAEAALYKIIALHRRSPAAKIAKLVIAEINPDRD